MPVRRRRTARPLPALPAEHCAAKSRPDGHPGTTVIEHCEEVGRVAEALVALLPDRVQGLLGASPATVAALHDVGKVSPGYQFKYFADELVARVPELRGWNRSSFEDRHATISEIALRAYLEARGRDITAARVAGAHHGVRVEAPSFREGDEVLGGQAWARERARVIERLEQVFGPVSSEDVVQPDVLAGLVCVADWIGSDERFFPPEGVAEEAGDREGGRMDTSLQARARRAVAACGWESVAVRPGLSFEEVFGFPPRAMQRDFISFVNGPGLYVLEAPMGLGKTEAALFAAYQLMAAGHHHGIYFGLPTRLTSDRIHERVRRFVERIVEGDSPVRLAHGDFWLRAFERGGEEFGAGRSWFRPSKRALLMPFAVGTIDQALLSVIKVKHHFVRSFGLAGKVVILDEVHSYDVYTGTLLDLLVRRLLEIGCTVIVLSATLTRARRAGLLPDIGLDAPGNGYPLTTREAGGVLSQLESLPPPDTPVSLSFASSSGFDLGTLAVEKALDRHCVLCVANTVAQAQRWYNEIKACMPAGAFDCGLLHAKFPPWRREALENLWMTRLGKHGDRRRGCVLVATQVVEQSVDIDADLMITDLAPTDMLLQRLGRLWRHRREDRPCAGPEAVVVAPLDPRFEQVEDLAEVFGKANSRVYDPYVLWRTLQVWRDRTVVRLPGDIRGLLEATYATPERPLPACVESARQRLETRRERLRRLAAAARSDVLGFGVQRDDERAATRYNDYPTIGAVLARSAECTRYRAVLELSDRTQVEVERHRPDPRASARLHANLVTIPAYRLRGARTPEFFCSHFHDDTVLLVMDETGDLLLDGRPTGLRYDDERGLQLAAGQTALEDVRAGRWTESLAYTDYDEDYDEDGLDGFEW